MKYNEQIEWLKQVESTLDSSSEETKERFLQVQNEVFLFESSFFEIIMNSILSELHEIEFIIKSKDINTSSDFIIFADNEILRHKKNIIEYGKQVKNLYSKENIIQSYETKKLACNERIEYSNRVLAENPDDNVSLLSKSSDEAQMRDLEYTIAVLKGTAAELQDLNDNAIQRTM